MVKKTSFEYLDEARTEAGFFVADACDWLGITERTWYRWQAKKQCPVWAYRSLKLRSGDLEFLGWKYWYLERGVLYRRDLNPKYYNWDDSDLMVSVWCDCPGHKNLRMRKHEERESRRFDDAATRGLRGASAPAFHLPADVSSNTERLKKVE